MKRFSDNYPDIPPNAISCGFIYLAGDNESLQRYVELGTNGHDHLHKLRTRGTPR